MNNTFDRNKRIFFGNNCEILTSQFLVWLCYVACVVAEIDDVFALFDTHGNQTIAISKLGTLMRALGQIPTQAELQAIIDEVDADGNLPAT